MNLSVWFRLLVVLASGLLAFVAFSHKELKLLRTEVEVLDRELNQSAEAIERGHAALLELYTSPIEEDVFLGFLDNCGSKTDTSRLFSELKSKSNHDLLVPSWLIRSLSELCKGGDLQGLNLIPLDTSVRLEVAGNDSAISDLLESYHSNLTAIHLLELEYDKTNPEVCSLRIEFVKLEDPARKWREPYGG